MWATAGVVTTQETSSRETLSPPQAPKWGVAALLAANAALATGPLFVRIADVGPVASGFWRLAIGFPLLTLLALTVGGARAARFTPALVVALALSGLLFATDLASWHLGIVRTKLANATLFGNCASLIFPLWAFAVARTWPSRREGAALALAGLGAAVLLGRSYELSPANLLGDLLSLLAGVFYTAYFIAVARARATLAPLPLLAASTLASAIPMLGFALLLHEPLWPGDWRPLVALAVMSQVVGQGLMVAALGRVRPLVIGVTLLTQPVVSALIGWTLFDERLTLPDLAGAAMVAVALVLVALTPVAARPILPE